MIDLYTWGTPNGRKVSIMLEECGLAYQVHKINIGTNTEQFTPEYLQINPNGKIPSIVDSDGPGGQSVSVMESGAILIYLAEKTGRFIPAAPLVRIECMQWLMFQMASVGPMFGQCHHFLRAAKEPVPYAIDRYVREKDRLYGVLDRRLGEVPFLAGEYSIADMATWPWVARHEWHQTDLANHPNVRRWFETIGAREAVKRGMLVP